MRQTIRFFSAMLAIMLAWQVSMAQNRTVTGTVKDQSGAAVIGASVIVKGTTTGTYTDENGNFTISVPAGATTLIFKYLGYKSQEVALSSSNVVTVSMEEDVLRLNEVVVTALGISREKKALGNATQQIDGSQIGTTGSGNVLHDLNGKVSGLTVINSAGDPGSGTYVRLRGVTSLTGNNQPLIVVDGIPMDNSINNYDPTGAGFQAAGASGNTTGGVAPDNRGVDINPDNIASITVLKGPAATALYGIQAASGALIITTKRGGPGAHKGPAISFSSSYSADYVNKYPELQNKFGQGTSVDPFTLDPIDATYAGPDGKGLGGITYPGSSGLAGGRRLTWGPAVDTLYWTGVPYLYDMNGRLVGQSDTAANIKFVPYDNLHNFFETGNTTNNNLAIGGGNDKSGYRFSVGNNHQVGVIPHTNFTKTTLSVNGQSEISSKLTASGSVSYLKGSGRKPQQGSNVSGIMLGLLRTPPTFDNSFGVADPANDFRSYLLPAPNGVYLPPDGKQRDYRGGPGYDNPYWTVNRNIFDETLNRVFGFGQIDYRPYSWMSWTYRVGGDVYAQSNKNGYDIQSNGFPEGTLFQDDYYNQQYNSDLILNLHKDFSNDFTAALILGHNYFVNTSSEHWAQGDGFVFQNFFDMANASTFLSHRIDGKKKTMAFYGDLTLGFKDMLFLELTGRDEKSSTLPADNNSFFFPSASLSWVFTDAFGLSSNMIFPYGKLRISAARVGKDAPVQGLETYFVSATVLDGFTGGITFPFNGLPGYQLGNATNVIGNPTLKPEFTNSFEFGIDLAFFRNRLGLSATYYHEKTTDQIFTVPISPSTGYAAALLNAGEIQNNGIELTLNLTPVKTKDFRWDITLNWSKNKNKVLSLYPEVTNLFLGGFQNGAVYAVVGEPYGQIYGPAFVRSDDGKLIIDDIVSDGDLGYGEPIPGTVNQVLGDINPDWLGSIATTLSWKGFSIGGQIDIHQGGEIWNGTKGALDYFGTGAETANRGTKTTFEGLLGHLDADGNIVHFADDGVTEVPGPGNPNNIEATLDQNYWQNIGSSFIGPAEPSVQDGSFVKLRELSIGYSLPQKLVSEVHLNAVSLSLFATNIILSTNYTGVDPETSLTGPANGQGLDYFNNPGIKSFGFRVNLGL